MMNGPQPHSSTPNRHNHLLHPARINHQPHTTNTAPSTNNHPVNNSTGQVNSSVTSPGSVESLEDKHSLKMKIKRTKAPTKTSEAKHEIVKSVNESGDLSESLPSPVNVPIAMNSTTTNSNGLPGGPNLSLPPTNNGSAAALPRQNIMKLNHKKEKRKYEVNGSLGQSIPNQQLLQQPPNQNHASGNIQYHHLPQPTSLQHNVMTPLRGEQHVKPPSKRLKMGDEASGPHNTTPISSLNSTPQTNNSNPPQGTHSVAGGVNRAKDVSVGTSVGTITEPDCLGPCEPGTSVTLEGIVWHETQGGVLVVNVTWRGKSYVGTLLDCTQHDWAPPRFCESPSTEELDTRTPKGRGKRGRNGGPNAQSDRGGGNVGGGSNGGGELSSVAETRSGKIRNSLPLKGRRGAANNAASSSNGSFATPNSPNTNKRKGRDADTTLDSKNKRSRLSGVSKHPNGSTADNGSPERSDASAASDQISPSQSPQLIECPEPNCNKKYKHINGLKYHQSHAHNNNVSDGTDPVDSKEENVEESSKENIYSDSEGINLVKSSPTVLRYPQTSQNNGGTSIPSVSQNPPVSVFQSNSTYSSPPHYSATPPPSQSPLTTLSPQQLQLLQCPLPVVSASITPPPPSSVTSHPPPAHPHYHYPDSPQNSIRSISAGAAQSRPPSSSLSTTNKNPTKKDSSPSSPPAIEEDPQSPAYSDISDAADGPNGTEEGVHAGDRREDKGEAMILQSGPGGPYGFGFNPYDSSSILGGQSAYLMRYPQQHQLLKNEGKETPKQGDEKKDGSSEAHKYPPGHISFGPSGGVFQYGAPPPHYTSDPFYAHLGPPNAEGKDGSQSSGDKPGGGNAAPALPPGYRPQHSMDPRLMNPLLPHGSLPMHPSQIDKPAETKDKPVKDKSEGDKVPRGSSIPPTSTSSAPSFYQSSPHQQGFPPYAYDPYRLGNMPPSPHHPHFSPYLRYTVPPTAAPEDLTRSGPPSNSTPPPSTGSPVPHNLTPHKLHRGEGHRSSPKLPPTQSMGPQP